MTEIRITVRAADGFEVTVSVPALLIEPAQARKLATDLLQAAAEAETAVRVTVAQSQGAKRIRRNRSDL